MAKSQAKAEAARANAKLPRKRSTQNRSKQIEGAKK
jgi:hypothetical protein